MGIRIDGVRIALLAFADDVFRLADTEDMAIVMLSELWDTLQRVSMDLQPNKCQWLALHSSSDMDALVVGEHPVPNVSQITVLGTVLDASDPAGAATKHRMANAWKA